MRLICPNCDAQYEIDGSVIPDTGRDVQCASCNSTWFQEPEGGLKPLADTPQDNIDPSSLDFHADDAMADYGEVGQTTDDPEPQELDESLLSILREEADLETQARRDEGSADLETQPDLGLEDPATTVTQRTARLRGIEQEQAAQKSNSRSDLLPDIEEINSTLRAASDRTDTPEIEPQRGARTRGFRSGFLLVVIIALIALVVYIFAPQISAAIPAVADLLGGYVDWVNGLRTWLDGSAQTAITNLSDLSGELPD